MRGLGASTEKEEDEQHRYGYADQPKERPTNFARFQFPEVGDFHEC